MVKNLCLFYERLKGKILICIWYSFTYQGKYVERKRKKLLCNSSKMMLAWKINLEYSFLFILLTYVCAGSLLLLTGFLQLRWVAATLHCSDFSLQSTGTWASVIMCTGLSALQHEGSSQTRDWTHVPCIGRRILNHRTTREIPRI